MPVRRGHVAPQNTYLDTIIRKFEGQSEYCTPPVPLRSPRGRGGPPTLKRTRERKRGGKAGRYPRGHGGAPVTSRGGRGVGDSQAASPRVFIDRETQGDEPSQPRCFPGGWGHRDPPEPPGWDGVSGLVGRGSRPAGLGDRGYPSAVGLAACLPSTLRSRRPPSLVKCCHLLLLRVIPLCEFFWGWFRVKYSEKSVHIGERWGLRVAGGERGGSTPTFWAPQRGWVPPTVLGMTEGDKESGVPQKLNSGGCCEMLGLCTPIVGFLWRPSFPSGQILRRCHPCRICLLPGPAVSDVTLGMESEKNCLWFLSAPPAKAAAGEQRGHAARRETARTQPGPPCPLPVPSLHSASHVGHQAEFCRTMAPRSPAAVSCCDRCWETPKQHT